MNASSNSTASVDVDVGEDSAVVIKSISSNSADSCTWYADASCKRPRTCYDCLNVKVASGECAIMPNGMCVSLAEYSHFFSKQQELGIFYKYYPSSKYTYCSADDSACSACTGNWVSDYSSTGAIETPAHCTGLDGCQCLARCELPDWSTSILTDQCSSSSSASVNSQTSPLTRIGFALAVGIVFGVLLGLWGIRLLLKRREIGRGRGSSIPTVRETWTVPRRPRTGPQLALTGWMELREKLIAIEKEVYGGAEVGQSRSENSTAVDVPDAAMEEGSAYYPVSPTQRRPRDAGRSH
ncbi:hypothetical protein F442_10795 [Phytophthora nicotianae P10297]|uniref:Uncharacterized protein n=1 Tax=Phytophthora nicotianae P10297 TaxID=1317064 RepID=W2Z5E8_PHYNI|nr:hypothetical protein F442_10795 [Phytophthora nicotianae P10297]